MLDKVGGRKILDESAISSLHAPVLFRCNKLPWLVFFWLLVCCVVFLKFVYFFFFHKETKIDKLQKKKRWVAKWEFLLTYALKWNGLFFSGRFAITFVNWHRMFRVNQFAFGLLFFYSRRPMSISFLFPSIDFSVTFFIILLCKGRN